MPIIRVMAPIGDDGYLASVARLQREYDTLLPLLEKYGVQLGVQNHCDRMVCNAMGLRHLIERYDPRLIGAVWDAAHNALNGEEPEMAIDIVWSHLCMVNLKNAYWRRDRPRGRRRALAAVVDNRPAGTRLVAARDGRAAPPRLSRRDLPARRVQR